MEWPRAILPQDLANLPIRRYEGELRLVASADALERELASMRRDRVLGFDTETRPAFRKGEAYPPSLVQLAGEGVVWILQLPRVEGPARLKEIFEAPDIVKAGVGVAEDLRQLKKLAGIVLGFRIPKGKRTSNWAAAQLTRQQIGYAAMDAWAARALYLALVQ
jgi:ribonuclease D